MAYIHPNDRPTGERKTRQQLAHLVGRHVVVQGHQAGYRSDANGRQGYVCLSNVFVYEHVEGKDCLKQPCVVVDHLWLNLLDDQETDESWERKRKRDLHQHALTATVGIVQEYRRKDGSWDYGVLPVAGHCVIEKLLCYRNHLMESAAYCFGDHNDVVAFVGIDRGQAERRIAKTLEQIQEVNDAARQRIFGEQMTNREWRRLCRKKRTRKAGMSAVRGFGHA